jgi:hypothetical protein
MPKGLSYLDAVRILGGSGPLAKIADNLLGGLLSVATAGGSDAALSFFDAKAEMVRLGSLVTAKINEMVRGYARYHRNERLLAASGVLVVASLFEALDDCFVAAGFDPSGSDPSGSDPPGFDRDQQLTLLQSRAGVESLLHDPLPLPSPARSYADLLAEVHDWCAGLATDLVDHLGGLAAADSARFDTLAGVVTGSIGTRAADHYDEHHRHLAGEIPEFAIWTGRLEARATAHSLRRLEDLLVRATTGTDPGLHRAALSRAYRAKLTRPVLGGDAGDLILPDLGDIYIDPRFQVKTATPGARPSEEAWWDHEVRDDIHDFLATYLTTTAAARTPLLLLGQPGAGKSSLTHILAARLPAADYLVARVPLREVPAEADIQSQIEHAIRAATGSPVTWAEMAEGTLSVVLLDGFDELLQATGLHQSDYLQRVAAFQERELTQNRPVAVMVTSRVVVADRARIPPGSLIVRLEPFDRSRIESWLTVWNRANPSADPLRPRTLDPLSDLAGQPLLLLMLALYHAGGNPIDDGFDSAGLYERLLSEFAAREVRRTHAGRPESAMPALVEEELLRLCVVAFAMFHRNRLWVTGRELDDDLAGLGLTPSRTAGTDGFRTPLTAAEEMIGRFFFIQHAKAVRDDKTFQTYEFLHATFGEYLVARLVVQAIRDTAARENAATLTLRFGQPAGPDLLQDLLGYSPLTARNTILQFVRSLLETSDGHPVRAFLLRRTRQAVTRPQPPSGSYRPVDKRIDHWMATYSFNLLFLTLACGGEVRATDLFTEAKDPAEWLRGSALQWRAALPHGMWHDALESVTVRRDIRAGRRDLVLTSDPEPSLPRLDPTWSNLTQPRTGSERQGYLGNFLWGPSMTSMHLSNNLSDDTVLHAIEPLVVEFPEASRYYVVHDSGRTESVAHSLVALWVTSGAHDDPDALADAHLNAVDVLMRCETLHQARRIAHVLLRALRNDAARLDPDLLLTLVDKIGASPTANDAVYADTIRTLLLPELRPTGAKRLEVLCPVFFSLIEGLEQIQHLTEALESLELSGDITDVLKTVVPDLNPADARLLSNEIRETRPHLAHLIR